MTQQTPVAAITTRKRPAMIGGLVGMVAVLGIIGYVAFGIFVTPGKPTLATASQKEVLSYITNSRGLGKLPRVEQEKFMLAWKQSLMADDAKKKDLKNCFDGMSDAERAEFTDAIFDHIRRSFVDDASIYARTPSNERYKFLRDKFKEYSGEALFVKDVGDSFKGAIGFNWSTDEQQKWVIEHTTPQERAICEPYIQALQDMKIMIRKEEGRNAESQPASMPG